MRTTVFQAAPLHHDDRLYGEAVGPIPPYRFDESQPLTGIVEHDADADPYRIADLILREVA